jgi:hypothetical protein
VGKLKSLALGRPDRNFFRIALGNAALTAVRVFGGLAIVKAAALSGGPVGIFELGQLQSFVSGVCAVACAGGSTGLVAVTAQSLARGEGRPREKWRASGALLAGATSAIMVIGFGLSDRLAQDLFHTSERSWLILAVCVALPFYVGGTALGSVATGQDRGAEIVRLNLRSASLGLVASTGAAFLLPWPFQMSAAIIAQMIQPTLLAMWLRREPWARASDFLGSFRVRDLAQLGKYWAMNLVSAGGAAVSTFYLRKRVASVVGETAAGQWQAVVRIAEVSTSVLSMTIAAVVLPDLARQTSPVARRDRRWWFATRFGFVASASALSVFTIRDAVITTLFDSRFAPARELFALRLTGDVIRVVGWVYAYDLVATGTVAQFIAAESVASIMLPLISGPLVSHFGLNGANLAYIAVNAAYLAFCSLSSTATITTRTARL